MFNRRAETKKIVDLETLVRLQKEYITGMEQDKRRLLAPIVHVPKEADIPEYRRKIAEMCQNQFLLYFFFEKQAEVVSDISRSKGTDDFNRGRLAMLNELQEAARNAI